MVKSQATKKRAPPRHVKRAGSSQKYSTMHLASRDLLAQPLSPIQIHSRPGTLTLSALWLGYAFALIRAVVVLVVAVLGKLGFAAGAVSLVESIHFTFSLTPAGIVAGMAETALWGFLGGLLFSWIYNKFV